MQCDELTIGKVSGKVYTRQNMSAYPCFVVSKILILKTRVGYVDFNYIRRMTILPDRSARPVPRYAPAHP